MRILHVISEKPPTRSGFSRVICRLTEELTRIGHEVDVLSANDCTLKVVGEIKLVLDTCNIDHYLHDSYDIINVHGHTPTFSDRIFLKSKLLGKRLAYTLHCPAGHYFGPLAALYNKIFNNLLLRLADAVIVTSKSYYDIVRSHPHKYLVPWGVDSEKFFGERMPHDDYKLLFVGQMRPYKGLKVLLNAMREIEAELSIVGDGPDRNKYVKYAEKLGLDNVQFYGPLSDDALRKLYLNSDVLVLPSISLNEAFGLVTLEAAAAGCAVVATELPGLRDVVGKFGYLVKPNDHRALRDAILTLKDNDIRAEYAQRGRSIVSEYSWQRVAKEYVNIYEDIIS